MKKLFILFLLLFFDHLCFSQGLDSFKYLFDITRQPHPEIKKGEVLKFQFDDSKIYPGTGRTYWVYIPASYKGDKPACLYVDMDGVQFFAPTVFDYLISKGEMPETIGVFISPGAIMKNDSAAIRWNRCHEFDDMTHDFVDFLVNELLPDVEKKKTSDGRSIILSNDANDRAIAGASSGGICAFNAAWQRPDVFSRVFCAIGTFVAMRGGDEYSALVRKTAPKPIRIFLQDGAKDTWNPLFGNWYTSNLSMEASLSFSGYEVAHFWGDGGHTGRTADTIFPYVMKWLWKGWPQKVQAGTSGNDMLQTILNKDENWETLKEDVPAAAHITADLSGNLIIVNTNGKSYKVPGDGSKYDEAIDLNGTINAFAFGPDSAVYVLDNTRRQLFSIKAGERKKSIAKDISGRNIAVTDKGYIYISDPSKSAEETGKIWLIKPDGTKIMADSGLKFASSITISPDKSMLMVAENNTNWIYSFVIQNDGTLTYKQRWYWLHQTEDFGYSETSGLIMDNNGNLYAATNSGIQVCDQNGRVRAILPLPYGPVTDVCFAGKKFDTLYVICNGKVYGRKLKIYGVPAWAGPVYPKSIGRG